MNKLVSIIIPCYNVDKYITKCFESILTQTYQNFEVIVIDDGSTDNTLDIIMKYEHLPNFKIITQSNKGVCVARNIGIDESKGEYMVFIDPDDYVSINFIEELLLRIEKDSSQLAVCGHTKTYTYKENKESKCSDNIFKGSVMFSEYFLAESPFTILMCDKMFISSYVKNNNIKFVEDITSGQDQIFILKYITYIESVSTLNNNNYFYFQREQSKSKRYEQHIFDKTLSKLDHIYDILNESLLYKEFRKYFLIRKYMNLFSQGFLAYKNLPIKEFKKSFRSMKKSTKKHFKVGYFRIFIDVFFSSKMNIREEIASFIIYFCPMFLKIKLYEMYRKGE
ncbi:MAG: glycosyltransferase [bacterium]